MNEILAAENRHFGYRVVNEIARFVCLAHAQSSEPDEADMVAFDLAVLEKVLPKLHGTQQELEDVLVKLFGFAVGRDRDSVDPANFEVSEAMLREKKAESDNTKPISTNNEDVPLPRTAMKLWRMCRRVRQQGFVSFIE